MSFFLIIIKLFMSIFYYKNYVHFFIIKSINPLLSVLYYKLYNILDNECPIKNIKFSLSNNNISYTLKYKYKTI